MLSIRGSLPELVYDFCPGSTARFKTNVWIFRLLNNRLAEFAPGAQNSDFHGKDRPGLSVSSAHEPFPFNI